MTDTTENEKPVATRMLELMNNLSPEARAAIDMRPMSTKPSPRQTPQNPAANRAWQFRTQLAALQVQYPAEFRDFLDEVLSDPAELERWQSKREDSEG